MASIFGGMEVVPSWVNPDSRFKSIAAGQETARNFMSAYESSRNRKLAEKRSDQDYGLDTKRFEEARRHNQVIENDERERRRAEAALEAERLKIERERREAEIREKARQAEKENNIAAAARRGAMMKIYETGRPPTPEESAQIIAGAISEFDPVNAPLARQRLLGSPANQFMPTPASVTLEDGTVVQGVTTGPGSFQVIPPKAPAKEDRPYNLDIFDKKGNKIGTRKATEAEFKEETEKQKKAAEKVLDKETAAKFLKDAKGDREKARALARAAGYTF